MENDGEKKEKEEGEEPVPAGRWGGIKIGKGKKGGGTAVVSHSLSFLLR